MACSRVLVLRSISALGTPRKVFLPLLRVATPRCGLVLTIFASQLRFSRIDELHPAITSFWNIERVPRHDTLAYTQHPLLASIPASFPSAGLFGANLSFIATA